MNNCPNENNNIYQEALNKIKHDQKFKPTCCVGPTGPTGPSGGPTGPIGATDTCDYFFKQINRNYSSVIPFDIKKLTQI